MEEEHKSYDFSSFLSSISYEDEIARAKRLKEDLDSGEGWTKLTEGPTYTYWEKQFPNDNVPQKIFMEHSVPIPPKAYVKMLDYSQDETRSKWDKGFAGSEILEEFPNDSGFMKYLQLPLPWPLSDRSFVLFNSAVKEIDWFGKQASFWFLKDAQHPAKPDGDDGLVRITNGGNFVMVMPDDGKQQEEACRVLRLSTNLYNGWIPAKLIQWLTTRALPRTFNDFHENMMEGYEKYYKQDSN